MDAAQVAEDNILLLLADSNLPLGGFHFSAGLESSTKHGFVPLSTSAAGPSPLLPFLAASLRQHARSTLSFVSKAYALAANPNEDALDKLKKLDGLYESMTSNHITRRGSKIQGVGMLTIWQKALKRPAWLSPASEEEKARGELVDALRQEVRDDRVVGHMPVCWGVLCGALGISHDRALHLHLYLQARALLSSSVRLNQTGPYHAQLLLLHSVPPLIAQELRYFSFVPSAGFAGVGGDFGIAQTREEQDRLEREFGEEIERGPTNTWPIGEMVQARHDVMHSRMFNT